MTLTTEQIEQILEGAPEGATHYVRADNEYWDLTRSNDHPKVFDEQWLAVDDDWGIDIFSTVKLSDLREILTLRQRVEELEAQQPEVSARAVEKFLSLIIDCREIELSQGDKYTIDLIAKQLRKGEGDD